MPTVFRIGATVSTGVLLADAAVYKSPADSFRHNGEYDEAFTPMIGGHPVLSRRRKSHETWGWIVRCRRSTGHQERLDDFAAIQAQIDAAEDFSLGITGTPIYLWEQYGNQTAVRQYLIIKGQFEEETRIAGGANLHIIGNLQLTTRVQGP